MKTKRRRSHHRPKFFFCLPLVLFFYFVGAKTTKTTTRFFEVEGKEAKVKPSEEDFGAILISEIMYNPIKSAKSSESSSSSPSFPEGDDDMPSSFDKACTANGEELASWVVRLVWWYPEE